MILTEITAPATLAVSVAEAKAHSYITTADEDTLIESFLRTAISEVEEKTGAALVTRTLEARFMAWPESGVLKLPRYPLVSVTSVKYTDSTGTEHTFAADRYWVDTASEPGRIWLDYGCSWPSATLRPGPSIVVRYVAGFGAAADVPDGLKQIVRLFFGDMYEHRERTIAQPGVSQVVLDQAESLIYQWRRW